MVWICEYFLFYTEDSSSWSDSLLFSIPVVLSKLNSLQIMFLTGTSWTFCLNVTFICLLCTGHSMQIVPIFKNLEYFSTSCFLADPECGFYIRGRKWGSTSTQKVSWDYSKCPTGQGAFLNPLFHNYYNVNNASYALNIQLKWLWMWEQPYNKVKKLWFYITEFKILIMEVICIVHVSVYA